MKPRTVLLIEDNEAALHIFSTILRHAGYLVLQARTGSEAFRHLETELPDVAVVDIGLPGVDGFEVVARLKAESRTREIPIVVATVHVFPTDEARALELGCDVFLRKPVEPLRLVAAVDGLLGERVPFSHPARS